MIGPDDITRWAVGLYPDFLRSLLTGREFFPLRRDRLGRVAACADAATFLAEAAPLWHGSKNMVGTGYKVIMERHSRLSRGEQNEPVAVEIETRDDFMALVGKRREALAFEQDCAAILAEFPAVKDALVANPMMVVDNHGAWPGVLEVVQYLCRKPRPGCLIRALPVSVHTKFVETHKGAIEMLLAVLPVSGHDPTGLTFTARCGFAEDRARIRGRFLCPVLRQACGLPVSDVDFRAEDWADLAVPRGVKVVVCENKANFLSLPLMDGVLALWGQGGAASGILPKIGWLGDSEVIYWGDIDPSGYAILTQLRRRLPKVASVLMDQATVTANASELATAKPSSGAVDTLLLTPDEISGFAMLSDPPRGLEQEKLLFRAGLDAVRSKLSPHG